jgi:hypothetical protein
MQRFEFEFETKYGTFRDAITLSDEEVMSESEINNLKQQRLDNWISFIENPPEMIVEPTEENTEG